MFPTETMVKEHRRHPWKSQTTGPNGHSLEMRTFREIGMTMIDIKMSLTAKFVKSMFGSVRRRRYLQTEAQTIPLPTNAMIMRNVRIKGSIILDTMLRLNKSNFKLGYSFKEAAMRFFSFNLIQRFLRLFVQCILVLRKELKSPTFSDRKSVV